MTSRKPGAMTRQEAAVIARAAKAAKAPPLAERFWGKVDRRGPDECWPWMAAVRRKDEGYGAFYFNGKQRPANRVALILSGTPVPEDMVACHRCDNPICCNPNHLFVGTRKENDEDRVAKGRQVRGERCHNAKLTREQVVFIRSQRPAGTKRLPNGAAAQLAAQFGVTPNYISALFSNNGWRSE